MKSKLITFILFIIMMILIFSLVIFGIYIYSDIIGIDKSELVKIIDNISIEDFKETTKTLESSNYNLSLSDSVNTTLLDNNEINQESNNKSFKINNFFYNQLTINQKKIYEGLYNNKENLKKGNYKIEYGNAFSELLSKEGGSKELGVDYQTAVEAFTHDNPDVFYINVNNMYLNIESTTKLFKTSYNVFISASENSNYWADGFYSYNQVNEAINAVEIAKNNVLNNLNGNDYQKIQNIHNYLVNSIEYDSTYSLTGSYSIYGALVGKKCVCEGYAKAFKYLVNSAGIECEIMQGEATNSSGATESHAWNCVKINDVWYLVDTTWDDPIIIGSGSVVNTSKYKYFLKGSITFEKDHKLSYQFSENGKIFEYPITSKKDY